MGKNPLKDIITSEKIERKDFSYSKQGVNLNFQLRTDIKKELVIFKEILEKAAEDVAAEIARVGGKQ